MQTLAPALVSYLDKYPDVSIRTYLSDRRVDLVGENYDLAIRIGALTDPTLMAKKLCAGRRVVCATPAYFKMHGRPQSPADLKAHNLVRGLIWRDEHFGGINLRDIARREGFSEGYVGQCIFSTLRII